VPFRFLLVAPESLPIIRQDLAAGIDAEVSDVDGIRIFFPKLLEDRFAEGSNDFPAAAAQTDDQVVGTHALPPYWSGMLRSDAAFAHAELLNELAQQKAPIRQGPGSKSAPALQTFRRQRFPRTAWTVTMFHKDYTDGLPFLGDYRKSYMRYGNRRACPGETMWRT
jgi:hypothetical protein